MPIIDNKKKIIILYTRLSPHSYSLFENMLLNKYISLEIFASCGNDIGNYFEYPNSKLKIHSLVSNNLKNLKKILITLFQQDVEAIYISGWQYLTYIFCVSFTESIEATSVFILNNLFSGKFSFK